jgi:hypothetical protein
MTTQEEVLQFIKENPGLCRKELINHFGIVAGNKISKLLAKHEIEEEQTPWAIQGRGLYAKGTVPTSLVEYPRPCELKARAGHTSKRVSLAACINCIHIKTEIGEREVEFGCDENGKTVLVEVDVLPADIMRLLWGMR